MIELGLEDHDEVLPLQTMVGLGCLNPTLVRLQGQDGRLKEQGQN